MLSHDVPATAGQHAQRSALIAHREGYMLHACLKTIRAVTQSHGALCVHMTDAVCAVDEVLINWQNHS